MKNVQRLVEIMERLRAPEGCPWDREQTFETLRPYVLEEAYEVAEAIDAGDRSALRGELGDLLLQVVFQAQIAREEGLFDFDDVAAAIADKLVRRHPHVFGEDEASSVEEVWKRWESVKRAEREAEEGARPSSRLDGIPTALPGLLRARLLSDKAARAGFDWPEVAGILDKAREELDEVEEALESGNEARIDEELGDLLFALASLARRAGLDPEGAIGRANRKFGARFRRVEGYAREQGRELEDLGPAALDALWQRSKSQD